MLNVAIYTRCVHQYRVTEHWTTINFLIILYKKNNEFILKKKLLRYSEYYYCFKMIESKNHFGMRAMLNLVSVYGVALFGCTFAG